MRQAFQLLVSLFLLQLIACGGEEEIRQPDTPAWKWSTGHISRRQAIPWSTS